MKNILFILALILFFLSCSDEENILPPINTSSEESGCKMDAYVYYCASPECIEEIPLNDIQVEVYLTFENAKTRTGNIGQQLTDNNGIVSFQNLKCSKVYIRIDSEENGTYITDLNLTTPSNKANLDVQFTKNYFYDCNDRASIFQNHISFLYPAAGQQSTYVYYQEYNHIAFDQFTYSDTKLTVTIIDQLSENSYLVEEKIDSIWGALGSPFYPEETEVENIWVFEEDSLKILPSNEDYYSSFIWNLSSFFEQEKAGYAIPLSRTCDNNIDMSVDLVSTMQSWSHGCAEDYNLLGYQYENLITEKSSYVGWDGPLKFRVYNLDDGFVRSMDFYAGMSFTTHGFDLYHN